MIPTGKMTEKVAAIKKAQQLLDECGGDLARAIRVLEAVADA